ncbi:MAG TPA: glycosyltransferase [Anaerolineales bacterium]|nr:glycosyltransferase [Anaerolineales bacterium]
MILLLFTASYPYDGGAEQTFLNTEIQHLRRTFDRVILVPRKRSGSLLPVAESVEVDETYSASLDGVNLFTAAANIVFSRLIYSDILARPSLLSYQQAIRRLISFAVGAQLTRNWVRNWIAKNKADPAECIFYTYWFDQAALGIGLAKRKYPQLRLVSRVHGYDLYEEYYYKPPYWPCRPLALSLLDCLFPDAQAGLRYLEKRYPKYASRYETSLLGVTEPGFVNSPSTDRVFRIVSCSMLEPVKRVDRILEGIKMAACQRPGQRFEWHHIGNGARRAELQKMTDEQFPPNAKGYLPGYASKEALMSFYRDQPADVFINASETEGTPVAVMEAVSCGIPVIATSVGGNQEIVGPQNGILLGEKPSAQQIADAIFQFLDHPQEAQLKRNASRRVWMERYNADANYLAFAERLKSIRSEQKAK